ncbi:DUF317 domain-containing protein [Streptomyces sp. AC563]|uniref:DUF317 domain-containing protein n=1 Tax=Streptomyces buecherae TaxID=2763006 RepID=UPI00164DED7A|nr:DUF317 domain-containing protein [Streptomyces buecherae]MBC3987532.1 DUF317 domain-containing protein [Streptomyces buecherae]
MPLSERQLVAFADKHAWQIPLDTSPRHLAGPGDARHVTHALAAVGWSVLSDPLGAEIALSSPDRRHRLQFDPQSRSGAWWRVRAQPTDTEVGWYAEFGELIPAEVLAGFTDALITASPRQMDPWQLVTSAGWHRDSQSTARSPDAMCSIERRPVSEFSHQPYWHVEARELGHRQFPGSRIWHAYFDEHTPARLVGSFLTALVDPRPLQRGTSDRTGHYSAVQEPSPHSPQQIVDAHTQRLQSLRARSRAARRQQTTPTTPAKGGPAQPAPRR